MLRIMLISGKEVTSIPLTELSDVKALKQRLHQKHGRPVSDKGFFVRATLWRM